MGIAVSCLLDGEEDVTSASAPPPVQDEEATRKVDWTGECISASVINRMHLSLIIAHALRRRTASAALPGHKVFLSRLHLVRRGEASE